MINKPFSESSEQNKAVIYETIKPFLLDAVEVLEIGSGTGQHAVHFASMVPGLIWQTSDLAENLPAINAWINDSHRSNLPEPIELDVRSGWMNKTYDLIFSANTFHIMNQDQVEQCLLRCTGCLKVEGHLIVYGPFNYHGSYTSLSNEQFDGWLKSRDPQSGIKHFEWINTIASQSGLQLISDIAMPANNRILIWRHETFTAE
jgi:cyclopropane fatty-acyl-phospholipid synthase-like methyltransferase